MWLRGRFPGCRRVDRDRFVVGWLAVGSGREWYVERNEWQQCVRERRSGGGRRSYELDGCLSGRHGQRFGRLFVGPADRGQPVGESFRVQLCPEQRRSVRPEQSGRRLIQHLDDVLVLDHVVLRRGR
jgi:hypothetical protein